MRKKIILLLLIVMTLILLPKPTYADMFSKPTAEIHIQGIDVAYQIEILIFYDGVASIRDLSEFEYRLEGHYDINYPVDLLNGYQDEDGYVARMIYSNGAPDSLFKTGDQVYKIGYYSPPRVFKVLLILENDVMLTSPIIHRNLFHSKIVFDLNGVALDVSALDSGHIEEIIPYAEFSVKYLLRVLFTIAIEMLVLLAFMYKQNRSLIIVGFTNFITQSILTISMIISFYFWSAEVGLVVTLIFGEILIFTVEMAVYFTTLNEQSKKRALLYGFVANLVTFVISIFTLGFI